MEQTSPLVDLVDLVPDVGQCAVQERKAANKQYSRLKSRKWRSVQIPHMVDHDDSNYQVEDREDRGEDGSLGCQ